MKIKVKNIFKEFIHKLKIKPSKSKKEGKVIKFNSNIDNNDNEVEHIRKGAQIVTEEKKKVKLDARGQKILISMIMLLLLTTTLNIRYKDYLNLEEYGKDVSSISVVASADENKEMKLPDDNVIATKAEEKVVVLPKKEEKLVFSSPLNNAQIQKMYSIDKVIYSKTLQQWKTHDGIDVVSASSSDVKSIEKGVVSNVYTDSFYGTTIEIEHINGYKSVYSNLDENVYVNIGESVIKGQKIGKLGNTSVGEYLDDEHLHFMLYLNDNSVDPTYIFN